MRHLVIRGQGFYYILTGLWPLVSMSTFEAVTGPKTEDWLVRTVGVLAITIGIALWVGARRRVPSSETIILACMAAMAFAGIDVVYALRGTISRIYLGDAAVEAAILIAVLASPKPRRRRG